MIQNYNLESFSKYKQETLHLKFKKANQNQENVHSRFNFTTIQEIEVASAKSLIFIEATLR